MKILAVALFLATGLSGTANAVINFNVVNNGAAAYTIDGVDNQTLTLSRGQTYTFTVSASGHPFFITTMRGASTASTSQFSSGVTNNGSSAGTITFAVPTSAPMTLFYQCGIHDIMGGTIDIVSPAVPATGPYAVWVVGALVLLLGGVAVRRRARE
jgi:hypothetical protein